MPYLRVKKLRKYMGVQDDLAVVAAGRALESAGLADVFLGERAGLYLVVGHLPFERDDLAPLVTASEDQGRFSPTCFSTAGVRAVNGLLTFRCLPNMPAFHISTSFDLQGPYFVTYPGPGQFYLALEEACAALADGDIDVALVGGVAHQRNFLVEHHFSRLDRPVPPERLADAAGCLVLETANHAQRRQAPVRGRLLRWEAAYHRHDPFAGGPVPEERLEGTTGDPDRELGAASLPTRLSLAAGQGRRVLRHSLTSRDGISASSVWELA